MSVYGQMLALDPLPLGTLQAAIVTPARSSGPSFPPASNPVSISLRACPRAIATAALCVAAQGALWLTRCSLLRTELSWLYLALLRIVLRGSDDHSTERSANAPRALLSALTWPALARDLLVEMESEERLPEACSGLVASLGERCAPSQHTVRPFPYLCGCKPTPACD